MNKFIITTVFCLLTAISAFAYSGGNGSETNPYLISSKADMEQLATNVNGGQTYAGVYFRLTRDLTGAADTITTIVGNSSTIHFSGVFNGNGYKIAVNKTGIFGSIKNATIKNLTVSGRITAYSYSHHGSTYFYYTGGICGGATLSTITNCQNNAKIEISVVYAYCYTGGICGYTDGVSNVINNCYNTNLVSGTINSSSSDNTYSYSGGICGYASSTGAIISNCYNTGDIKASAYARGIRKSSYAGGICGRYSGKTQNCFTADCKITNGTDITRAEIGRIGGGGEGSYTNCYANDNAMLNGDPISSSNANSKDGKDATTANLQNQAWLVSNLSWDFASVWCMPENGQFPELQIKYPSYQEAIITMDIPSLEYGAQITLNAQTNNNIAPVVYSSSDNTIAEVSGSLLIAKKAGTVTITASQPSGNGFFAAEYAVIITVNKKELIITPNSASRLYGESNPAFSLSYSDFVNGDSHTSLQTLPNIVCLATQTSPVGSYAITVSGGADNNYNFIYQNAQLQINKTSLTVKPNDVSREYGENNPAFVLTYSGFKNNETENALSEKPTVITNAKATSSVGDYDIIVSGGMSSNYEFSYQTGKLTITKASQTIVWNNIASKTYGDDDFYLPATTDKGLSISYSVANENVATIVGNTVHITGAGTTNITATQAGNDNYFPASSVTLPFTVSKSLQSITFNALSAKTYGDAAFALQAGVSSNLPIVFESSNTNVATVSGNTVTILNAGTTYITASVAGNDNYYAANPAQQPLTINKATQSISLSTIPNKTYGDEVFTLSAEVSTGLPITYTSSAPDKVFISGNQATILSAGNVTITAQQAGNNNYLPASDSKSFVINKANLTVSAEDKQREYGDVNPVFNFSYEGFVNGDTEAKITKPTASTTATIYSNVGNYNITCSGGNATNYNFVYKTGILEITKVPLIIKAEEVTFNQGEWSPNDFIITYSGFVNNDDKWSAFQEMPQIQCAAGANDVGTFILSVVGGTAQNYELERQAGTLTILPAPSAIETVENNPVSVYPNPTNGVVHIKTEYNVTSKVKVYSSTGKLMLTETGNQVDISPLPTGLYIFQVDNKYIRVIRE